MGGIGLAPREFRVHLKSEREGPGPERRDGSGKGPGREDLHHTIWEWDPVGVAEQHVKTCGNAQGFDLGDREALRPMSVRMTVRSRAVVVRKELRMEASLGPTRREFQDRRLREEMEDP